MDPSAPFSVTVKPSTESSKRNAVMEVAFRYLNFGMADVPEHIIQLLYLKDFGFPQLKGYWAFCARFPQDDAGTVAVELTLMNTSLDTRAAITGSFQILMPKIGTWIAIAPIKTVLKHGWKDGHVSKYTVLASSTVSRRDLTMDHSDYVKDGVLLVKVEFEFSLEFPSTELAKTMASCTAPHCVRRAELFRTKASTDFVLVSSDGRQFPVHRFMLASQSKVFAAMLKPGMAEARSGRCNIEDVDGETLDVLVEFLYTSCPGRVGKNAENVLKAADKYEIVDLVAAAVEHLSAHLDMKNAAGVYVLATERKLAGLEKTVTTFIMNKGDHAALARVWKEVAELLSKK